MALSTPPRADDASPSPGLGSVALVGGVVVVAAATLVLLWSGVTLASGKISAATGNAGSDFGAASIDLVVEDGGRSASTALVVDTEGLYPGLRVERCVEVTYHGTLEDVPIRLSANRKGGSGLERHLDTVVEVGSGAANDCSDFVAADTVFAGVLSEIWIDHGTYESGVDLIPAANDGATTSVRLGIEVRSDNEAQGLTTDFWLIIEGRG